MTGDDEAGRARPDEVQRYDNGLRAQAYVPLTDVDLAVGRQLLDVLGRARIPAYLRPSGTAGAYPRDTADGGTRGSGADDATGGSGEGGARQAAGTTRLYVASEERVDARSIVAAAVRALNDDGVGPVELTAPAAADPLAGVDTDAAFRALVADWHVDTHDAIRRAERDLTREDRDWRDRLIKAPIEDPVWLDDDHYVPPPPPPLPRLAARTVLAIALLAFSIVLLGWGVTIGLPGNLGFVLGILGVLTSGGLLLTRLHDAGRDEDDDGSAV